MTVDLDAIIIRANIGSTIHRMLNDYEAGNMQNIWQDA